MHADPGCAGNDCFAVLRATRLTLVRGVILQLGFCNLKMILPWNREAEINYVCDTLCRDKDVLTKYMYIIRKRRDSFSLLVHTPLNTTLAVQSCGVYIDKYLLQALLLLC